MLPAWLAATLGLAISIGFAAGLSGAESQPSQTAQGKEQGGSMRQAARPVNTEEEDAYRMLVAAGDSSPANRIMLCEDFVKRFPQSRSLAGVYATLATAYASTGEEDKMFASGSKALELNPDNVDVLSLFAMAIPRRVKANAPDALQQYEKAEGYARRVIELIPNLAKPYNIDDATFEAEKNDKLAMAHSGLGMAEYQYKSYGAARTELTQAVQLSSIPDPVDFYMLGNADILLGNYKDAIAAYEKCAKSGPLAAQCKAREDSAQHQSTTSQNQALTSGQKAPSAPIDYGAELAARPAVRLEDFDTPLKTLAKKPHAYALVVGIEHYKQSLPEVPYALKDAAIVRRYLISEIGVPDENVLGLGDPSYTQLRVAFEDILNLAKADTSADTMVYFYYAGHGVPDIKNKVPYLVPVDADVNYIEETSIDLKEISDKLKELPGHSVLWLDSCFTGSASRSTDSSAAKGLFKGQRPAFVEVPTPSNPKVIIFSAATAEETSNALEPAQHGLFTYYLLSGLHGNAAVGGKITVRSLYDYIQREVPKRAASLNQKQTPELSPPLQQIGTEADTVLVKLP
jgi:tetratricopeptide (TPR) repeat protein